LNHAEFLELAPQDELVVRNERLIGRRMKAAAFRELKTLEDFDFSFNTSVKKHDACVVGLRPGHRSVHS
jgi:DNA replication protein DnaC